MSEHKPTRREFVASTAAATAGFMIVPRHVLGRGLRAPSDTVNIASVGVNGMGASNTAQVMGENIVAICDVDYDLLDKRLKAWQDSLNPAPPRAGGGRRRRRQSSARRRPKKSCSDAGSRSAPRSRRRKRMRSGPRYPNNNGSGASSRNSCRS
jgi:hypothetical protein